MAFGSSICFSFYNSLIECRRLKGFSADRGLEERNNMLGVGCRKRMLLFKGEM